MGWTKQQLFTGRTVGGGVFTKREERVLFYQAAIFAGGRGRQGFYFAHCLSFLWGMEEAQVTDALMGAVQEIPDCLVKSTFLVKVKTSVRYQVWVWYRGL